MEDKELSCKVSCVMDHLGYGLDIAKHRRETYREIDRKVNSENQYWTRIKAGSKGEGLSCFYESDHDTLHVDHYTVCTLEGDKRSFPETYTVFTMLNGELHPGHYELKRKQQGTMLDLEIAQAMVLDSESGDAYISSELYTKARRKDKLGEISFDEQVASIAGPSVPGTDGKVTWDSVHAFRCVCQQQLLQEWINRPRHHNWPPPDLVEEIAQVEAQLVPVGCKGSENRGMEWRVCFIPSELKLSESWNEAQYKLYILLKMINKATLKPICEEMSSYILKNIVFWMAEAKSRESFTSETLLNNLTSSLEMLEQCIQKNELFYYMIRSRNLLTGRLGPKVREQLCDKLKELIREGPNVVLRCQKVNNAIQHLTPAELEEKGRLRDDLERMALLKETIWNLHDESEGQGRLRSSMVQATSEDNLYALVSHKMCDLVWSDWRLHVDDEDFQEVVQSKIRAELS